MGLNTMFLNNNKSIKKTSSKIVFEDEKEMKALPNTPNLNSQSNKVLGANNYWTGLGSYSSSF